jgi:hypothetical protein
MNIQFDISEAEAKWGVDTIKRVGVGLATGVGLPSALSMSFLTFLRDVRSVTPPASGETVGSLSYRKGRLAITIDLLKAFKVVAPSSKLASNTDRAYSWYQSIRGSNGRPRTTVKMAVTLQTFKKIEATLHSRVGYLQAGWNSASSRLGQTVPAWVNKSAPGSFSERNDGQHFSMKATNGVRYAGNMADMEKAIRYAQRRATFRLEKAAQAKAQELLNKEIKK